MLFALEYIGMWQPAWSHLVVAEYKLPAQWLQNLHFTGRAHDLRKACLVGLTVGPLHLYCEEFFSIEPRLMEHKQSWSSALRCTTAFTKLASCRI